MAAAHDSLSPTMQSFAERLRAVHYPATTWPGPHARNRPEEARPGEVAIDMAVTAFVGEAEGVPAVLFKPSEV